MPENLALGCSKSKTLLPYPARAQTSYPSCWPDSRQYSSLLPPFVRDLASPLISIVKSGVPRLDCRCPPHPLPEVSLPLRIPHTCHPNSMPTPHGFAKVASGLDTSARTHCFRP